MKAIAMLALLAMSGCMPKNLTVITDTTAFTEWTMPARVVIVPPPYCEQEYQRFRQSAMNPMVPMKVDMELALKVIYCYRKGYEAL